MGHDLRALLVSYAFPPVGGAGVQRVLKLAKYLPLHGIAPAVLTAENPSVPVRDESLLRDVAEDLEVVRARTLEPSYAVKQAAWSATASQTPSLRKRATRAASAMAKQLLIPDPQVLWQPGAQRALAKRVLAGSDDAVLISAPPFSQFLLTPLCRMRPRVGVVLDYRDEWSTYRTTYEMMGSRLGNRASETLEPALLKLAHVVTTATDEFRDDLLARFRFLDPARVLAIPNGYDPADFPGQLPSPPADRFVLTYAGTLFKLTSARGLLGAIRKLHSREPDLAKLLDVRFLGRIVDTELPYFEGSEALGVSRLGYVPHDSVLPELARSHEVLCLLDDVPGVERIFPAKIFELMHLGRPILTLAPTGALSRLVAAHALGDVISPRDEAAIATHLERRLRAFQALPPAERSVPPAASAVGIERFDRRALAGEFASGLRMACELAGR